MTYLVAFVDFPGGRVDYNMNCLRTDISPGDRVLVRLKNGKLRPGKVRRIEYLDWDCGGRIECKRSEAVQTPQGMAPPPGSPRVVGLVNIETMAYHLKELGWRPLKPASKTHRVIYTYFNGRDRANIWLRRRGVDLQILADYSGDLPRPYSPVDCSSSVNEGRTVRHALSQTTFNLYEGVARFAEAFMSATGDYDRFFQEVGSRKRTTSELLGRTGKSSGQENFEAMLYSALGGDGGLAYVGDGLYLGSDGSWHDG